MTPFLGCRSGPLAGLGVAAAHPFFGAQPVVQPGRRGAARPHRRSGLDLLGRERILHLARGIGILRSRKGCVKHPGDAGIGFEVVELVATEAVARGKADQPGLEIVGPAGNLPRQRGAACFHAPGSVLLREEIPLVLAQKNDRIVQNEAEASSFPRRRPEDGEIDWRLTARDIHNLIRALVAPLPGAFYYVGGEKTVLDKYLSLAEVTDLKETLSEKLTPRI